MHLLISFTGLTAAFVDVSVHWLTDLKLGFCKHDWWLHGSVCCGTVREGK
jgi:hypothetical protein